MIAIPQASPQLRFARYRAQVDAAIARVIDSGLYVLGPAVAEFEASFAAYLGAGHAVGVGSGTDAVALALRAIGIGPGDEVIAPALTAAGTAQGILASGASVRFAEVDASTRCLDPAAAAAAVTPRTAAIVAVHLFGQPCDVVALAAVAARHGLALVEDAAQAHGASVGGRRIGTFGQAAAFSFYPTKPLGALGDGGAVVTSDPGIAERVRALRVYGWDGPERISRTAAGNSRLDTLQAAVLSALLPSLDKINGERRVIAAAYRDALAGQDFRLPPDDSGAVYHQFAIRVGQRDRFRSWLAEQEGIGTNVHYYPALHEQPAFAGGTPVSLPVTEALAGDLVSLPIEPEVVGSHSARIAAAVLKGISLCGS
jgi:dTDP-4-amino-4,6-dideoxygalactose transaminase